MQNLDIFPPSQRESAVDYVINTIKNLLLEKKLKPGDMLPSEGALAESMKVSRGPVREAMKILSAFGIVEIKRGDGTYIAAPNSKSIVDPFLLRLILSDANSREMAELRELLETQIVTLVIRNADREHLENLEQVHSDMKKAFEASSGSDKKDLLEYDLKFHAALGKATNNVLIEAIYGFTMELFKPYITKTYENRENGMRAIALHEGILEAIREKNITKAIDATRKSIDEWWCIFDIDKGNNPQKD
ncbi:MAG TPA: FadR family transcriptional regulator [Clostridiales bacterium]|nr:FadR family transcriptional regulator [Clostridiales bacterium]